MARESKPWYWKARKTWCVYIAGKKHVLGPDRDEAKRQFHNLMGQRKVTQRPVGVHCVAAILDDFLDWTKENRAKGTYLFYKHFCQSFSNHSGLLDIAELTAAHVTAWLKEQLSWNSTTKHDAVTCLKRALNWAVKNRGLTHSPIAKMEKAKAKNRTEMLNLSEMKKLLRASPDKQFRDLLRFCWYTGCRPQETKQVEAHHVDLEKNRCTMIGKGDRIRVIGPVRNLVSASRNG